MIDRSEAMEKEFSKAPGGNYFNYVNTTALTRLGITQWKPIVGENAIRIVYPPDRPGFYGMEVYKHGNVGVNRKTFTCKKRMFNLPCPVCSYTDTLKKEDPNDKRAEALYAGRRYLFFVVDVSSEETMAKGVRWFDCPIGIYKEIQSRSKNKRRGAEGEAFKKYVDVSHPVEGRDICFTQVKEKGKYSYVGVELITSDPIPETWYKDLPEFKDILKEATNEEMEEALTGEGATTTQNEEPETETTDEEVETDTVETEVETTPAATTTPPPVETKPTETQPIEVKQPVTTRAAVSTQSTSGVTESSTRNRVRERLAAARKAQTGGA